ncbi:hypothetical protein H6F94_03725 [Leptolyngbya sp. FACHB-261]|nr:hypothetical protein [Leptolyngbya sp. FACHB-261]
MAEKYKRTLPVREVFINNLKGKLGEEVVKIRLSELVTEVDYERRLGGDGKVDFYYQRDPSVGIQVKVRYGDVESVRWQLTQAEAEQNSVLVCVLMLEDFEDTKLEYRLILAGFLPTNALEFVEGVANIGISDLLYGGGLKGYLQDSNHFSYERSLMTASNMKKGEETEQQSKAKSTVEEPVMSSESASSLAFLYLSAGSRWEDLNEYTKAIENFSQAVSLNPHENYTYRYLSWAQFHNGNYQDAINNSTAGISRLLMYLYDFYCVRVLAYQEMERHAEAIKDCDYLIGLAPNYSWSYYIRGESWLELEKFQRANEDYSRALALGLLTDSGACYHRRGHARLQLGDKVGALSDWREAAKIHQESGDEEKYQDILREIEAATGDGGMVRAVI